MPTVVIASSKGGPGKTTVATSLASELARLGEIKKMGVTLIDSDPNQHAAKWALKEGCPNNITLVRNSTEKTIIDDIENAEEKTALVVVDTEGTASMTVLNAVSFADLVIIPCQGAQDDADEALKTIDLIMRCRRSSRRNIPFSILFNRTHPAIEPKGLKHIVSEFSILGIDVFKTSIVEREALRTVRSVGGTVNDLTPKDVSGADKAAANSNAFALEVIRKLNAIDLGIGVSND